MKLILLSLLLTAWLVSAHLNTRHESSQNHEILDQSWAGGSDSACDKECRRGNGTVCGSLKKECCDKSCTSPYWTPWVKNCDDGHVKDIKCSVLQSITGSYWKGTECDADCTVKNGKVCGDTFKQCCADGCDVGKVYTSCLNSKQIEGLSCNK